VWCFPQSLVLSFDILQFLHAGSNKCQNGNKTDQLIQNYWLNSERIPSSKEVLEEILTRKQLHELPKNVFQSKEEF
jgi:hypothetical protein